MNPRLVIIAKTLFVAVAAYSVINIFSQAVPYGLVFNRTESIPVGFYWSEEIRAEELTRGDLACFPYAAPAWAKDRNYLPEELSVCKPMAGKAGDIVNHQGDKLFVTLADSKESRFLGDYTHEDSRHRALPQDALTNGPIPDGWLLMVAGAHANSLDSRYMGLIHVSAIKRRIHPIYTW